MSYEMAGSIAGEATSLATSIGNWIFQQDANQANRAFQREMTEYMYSKDLEQWERTNEYNTPYNQVQRLKAAGLNPALMYSKGTGGGEAAAPVKYQGNLDGHFGENMTFNMLPNISNAINAYQQMQMNKANIDKINSEKKLIDDQAFNMNFIGLMSEIDYMNYPQKAKLMMDNLGLSNQSLNKDITGKEYQNMTTQWMLDHNKKLEPYQLEAFKLTNDKTNKEIANILANTEHTKEGTKLTKQDINLKRLQSKQMQEDFKAKIEEYTYLKWNYDQMRKGENPTDNWIYRQAQKIFGNVIEETTKAAKKGDEWLMNMIRDQWKERAKANTFNQKDW